MASTATTLEPAGTKRRRGGVWGILSAPLFLLLVFFVIPMAIMVQMSFLKFPPNTSSGYTLTHFTDVLTDPVNLHIAGTTLFIATVAQLVMLAIGIPLAYFMVFKAGKWELPLLLALVLADELNPIVKIYAWETFLGTNGLVNKFLVWSGLVSHPVSWLLFSRFAVIVVLSASYITYTTIPIYAAMKAMDPAMFEAAVDLGAGWWTKARRILIPLAAPGIFVAMILVYIPMFTDFATAGLIGGTRAYMLGNRVTDLILEGADWGNGSALNFVLLVVAVVFSFVAYKLAKLNRIES
ncbi:MAG: ABC transporter permease [Actinomycetota bacterium]|nr:ABC transporter permease [Actinomycetota bacterium]